MQIRIQIQQLKLMRIHADTDPDPQPRVRQRTQEVHNELLSGTTSIKDRYIGTLAIILHFVLALFAVMWIHYIFTRILGSVPMKIWIRIRIWILLSSVADEMPTKKVFSQFFAYYFLNAHLHQPSKTKSRKEVTKK
jgi:hypothetical protein